MADVVNAGDFFESANQQTAVLYLVAANFDDSQTNYLNSLNSLNPQRVEHFRHPEDVKVQRVAKGAPYPIDIGFGLTIVGQGTAKCDGYLLKPEDNRFKFLAAAAYAAIFGDQNPVEGQMLFVVEEPNRCVLLEKDTTFGFLSGNCSAKAGSVLYEDPEDEDGYVVVPQIDFFQRFLILR